MRSTPLIIAFIGLAALGCSSSDGDASPTPFQDTDADAPDSPGTKDSDGGDDPDADSGTPGTPTKWSSISLSSQHACALTVEGKAYCWGVRHSGACGDGEASNEDLFRREPYPVASELSFTKISAGDGLHTCAIDTAQKLHCWGANYRGQIGDGGPQGSNDDSKAALRFSPVAIRSDLSFVDVSAGRDHTCAIDTAGKLYCWGGNGSDQAGGPSSQDITVPTAVMGAGPKLFEQVALAAFHSCAVGKDGVGYCWGKRDTGNIGDGQHLGSGSTPSPTAVASGAIQWQRIAAGNCHHTCGIEKGTGDVYCWGDNGDAQLGVEPSSEELKRTSTPQKTTSGFKAIDIVVLNGNTCALDSNGAAFCWGMDDFTGVIANGEEFGGSTFTRSPIPQPVTGGHTFVSLTAASSMVCGTTTEGDVYCWGDATSTRFLNAEKTGRNATPRKLPDPS